jgi:hypothetical protein
VVLYLQRAHQIRSSHSSRTRRHDRSPKRIETITSAAEPQAPKKTQDHDSNRQLRTKSSQDTWLAVSAQDNANIDWPGGVWEHDWKRLGNARREGGRLVCVVTLSGFLASEHSCPEFLRHSRPWLVLSHCWASQSLLFWLVLLPPGLCCAALCLES